MKSIDKIYLPEGSDNEDLEITSRRKFEQLFDVARFIHKPETIDNGVDYRTEININKKKTGFGFNFQLKSKIEAKKNSDGTYSKSIETSNIEYLINNAQPAFYGFYVKNEDKIYYEYLNDFIQSLHEKSIDWEDQPNHTLRFNKVLDSAAVEEIFNITLKKGKLLRELTYRSAITSSKGLSNNKILIDFNENITDDNEIREMIETIGFDLINEGRWNEIIQVHKSASGSVAITATYNLVLGIANFYSGNLVNAVSFFKTATKLTAELSNALKDHLLYFYTTSRYAIGMISKEEHASITRSLEDSENVGLYVKLEKAKGEYISEPGENEEISYNRFSTSVQDIIDNPKASDNIKLLAKCELLLFEGHKNNMDYIREISRLNILEDMLGPNLELRAEGARNLIFIKETWFKKNQDLQEEAQRNSNQFAYFNSIANEVKIHYELDAFSDIVYIKKSIPDQLADDKPDRTNRYLTYINYLNSAFEFYNRISHVENSIVILSQRYELELFTNNKAAALVTIKEIENLIDTVDSVDLKRRFEFLKNGGTTHEQFKEFTENIFKKSKKDKQEIEAIIRAMEMLDQHEQNINVSNSEKYTIDLLPIGYFQFPKKDLQEVFSILNITEDAQNIFLGFFSQNMIPMANIHYTRITGEGPLKGHFASSGIESWRNIYRIRKLFFEKKYLRFNVK